MTTDSLFRQSVIDLHVFFEDWFSGSVERTALADFESQLDSDFTIVNPDGTLTTRAGVLREVESSYGKVPDFVVEISDFSLIARDGNLVVASYVERQQWSAGTNKRRSTALFITQADSRHGCRWRHVHETWLDAMNAGEGTRTTARPH